MCILDVGRVKYANWDLSWNPLGATCRVRRPRRTAAAIAARNAIVEFIICLRVLQQSNILYFPRFGIFFLFEKENACKRKAKQGESPCTPANAAPQYIARGSKLVARHIRAQTRRSLNECALVRLASQAVPSLSSVSYYYCGAAMESLIIKII